MASPFYFILGAYLNTDDRAKPLRYSWEARVGWLALGKSKALDPLLVFLQQ